MATALKTPPAGMTGAVRSLQWTIQDLNGSVEHLAQSHDVLRRAQNIMAWTTAIFGVLLLSGLVWIANDIFHVKDQIMETDRRFDGVEAQITALGTRMDDLNLTVEQVGAELLASRGLPAPAAAGPQVSVLSTPTDTANVEAAAGAALETNSVDAAAVPQQAAPAPQTSETVAAAAPAPAPAPTQAAEATASALTQAVVAPSPPAPRDQLTPEELAQQSPVTVAAAPANTAAAAPAPASAPAAPAAAAPTQPADSAAATTTVAAAPAAEAPPAPAAEAPAPAPAAAAPAADLSDDQLLSYNDDQIDPADELLLLDENGNPQ